MGRLEQTVLGMRVDQDDDGVVIGREPGMRGRLAGAAQVEGWSGRTIRSWPV